MRRMATDTHHRALSGGLRATAAAVAIFFASTQAAASAPEAEGPAPAPTAAPAPEGPAPAPAPEAAPAAEAPVSAEPAPAPEGAPAPEPAPAPEAAPEPAPAPEAALEAEGPAPEMPPMPMSPEARKQAKKLRRAGVITMGAGGALSLAGMVLTVGYTLRGNGLEQELITAQENVTAENCSRNPGKERCPLLAANVDGIQDKLDSADMAARYGGVAILSGIAVIAVGGVLYSLGTKRLKKSEFALSPTLGGAVLRGRF